MLYRFEVENFFSIRDKQVIDLTIDKKVIADGQRFARAFKGADFRVPKVVALFGANASGKTTVLRALSFLISFVRDSVNNSNPGIPDCERFNDAYSASRPMKFALEFGGLMNPNEENISKARLGESVQEGIYRYELELEVSDGHVRRIARESLRQRPNAFGKWQRIFERGTDGSVTGSSWFRESGFKHLQLTLANNHTIISSFAKFQHPTARLFADAARKVYFLIAPLEEPVRNTDPELINFLKQQPEVLSKLSGELGRIDVGIEEMKFTDSPNGPLLRFRHRGLQLDMPWGLQSHGTRAFIRMYPALLAALDSGGICLIDEMDAAIHPNILPEIVHWFNGSNDRNKLDAQLWITCHSASLLDDLLKEEVIICEKDLQGRTQVHSLMDVKIRRDGNHYRKYLSGVYGGVPRIG